MAEMETYLKTQQVADALGVSVSTIKRWVDSGSIEATRTLGKHRLVLLSSVLEFANRENFPAEKLLSLTVNDPQPAIDERTCESLTELLKGGRAPEAAALITTAYQTGRGAAALADLLIRPAMERIGHGWSVGDWDVYQEHQASQIVASVLTGLISRAASTNGHSRPLALGAAPEGDIYVLPGLLGELVLREVGWDVRYLGGNLPLRSLASAIRHYRPGLVFLSASHLNDRAQFLHDYSYFYELASRAGAAIILGGRAFDPDLRSKLVYASFGDRMAHLAEFARRLLPSTGANLDPATNLPGPMNITT